MGHRIRHLSLRDGTYYYSRRVPKVVDSYADMHLAVFGSGSHYRVSLGTKVQAEALARFAEADLAYNEKVALARPDVGGQRLRIPSPPPLANRKLTLEILRQIEREIVRQGVARWRRKAVLADLRPDLLDEFNREVDLREQDAEELRSILIDRDESADPRFPNIRELATELALENQLAVEGNAEAMAMLMSTVRKGLLSAERAIDQLLQDGEGLLDDLTRPEKEASPRLSRIFADFGSSKTTPRTVAEIDGTARRLIELLGDKQIHEVTAADIRSFLEAEGLKVVGGRDPGSVRRSMSEATLRKKLALTRAAINHCIDRGSYGGLNPASKVKVGVFARPVSPHAMPTKRAFRVAELEKIFEYPWFVGCASESDVHNPGTHRLSGMHFWVPIVAALTGMRAGEIGGLKASEVLIDDANPHIWVRPNEFRSTKSGKSRRVPILDCLFDVGFGDFVESVRLGHGERLFEDWERPRKGLPSATEAAWSNGALLRSFNRILIPNTLDVGATGLVRREVTFHSFRGAYKSMLGLQSHQLPPNYINEVIGHSKTELDKRYIGEIPIEETYKAIRKCHYEGLTLPRCPSTGTG